MNVFLTIIGIILIIIFFIPVFDRVMNFGCVAGMVAGGAFVALGFMINKLNGFNKTAIIILSFSCLALMVGEMGYIYSCGRKTAKDENVIIVLGCKIHGDIPSLALSKRIDSAYEYMLSHRECIAVLSGGQGSDENLSEAQCMADILISRGIKKERLILENRSTNTDENIRFSLKLIEEMDLEPRVAIATSEYHQLRAKLICSRYNIASAALPSKTKATILPAFLLREAAGIIKEKYLSK